MGSPADRNRLDEEASPYLRQHADNPVHWQPWDDAALSAARERDVPIFLSTGYAACHWCHVMEEESFVDETVAEVLNESFVPIKVDREERPDVDRVYQTACQFVSGRGGWPLSAFLTPSGEPFYVGTYFPRESRGRVPGFLDVLEDVASSWQDPEARVELEAQADRVTSRVREALEDAPTAGDAAATWVGEGDPEGARPAGEDERSTERASAPGQSRPGQTDAESAPGPLERVAAAAVRSADRQHGGWGSGGPKFPQPRRIQALLEAGASAPTTASATTAPGTTEASAAGESADASKEDDTQQRPADEDVAVAALAAMVDGGLYDHVGGGFHRYCTDREWVVPHFEKMLYDNAEIARVLLAAHQVTGRERYARVARETFEFLDRELAQADGAFASTLDARSAVPPERTEGGEPGEHEEGAYYVWTPAEVERALDGVDPVELLADADGARDGAADDAVTDEPSDDAVTSVDPDELGTVDLATLVCDRYGITEAGNFEGRTVLTVDASLQSLATDRDVDPATVRALLDGAREQLREHRAARPRPRRDDKVIGAWNGLAIHALAEGAIVLEDDGLADRALSALDAVRTRLWDGERLRRRYVLDAATPTDGGDSPPADVQGEGYLEDYAFLGRAALACYESTGSVEALAFALDLGDAIVEQFYDEDAGTLYFTPDSGESLIARPQEPTDQSTPSSLGVGADLLASLDAVRTDDRFDEVARRVVRSYAGEVERNPLQHPSLCLAAERLRSGATEVTIASDQYGDADDRISGLPAPWRSWLASTFLPRRHLAPRPASDDELAPWLDALGLDAAPPIWAGREAADGPTAYVCRGFTCSRPLRDPDAADEWLAA